MLYTSLVDYTNMNKPPISFRLTDKEWEVLEREQQANESINQTAARLLRERLGIQDVDNEYTLESTTLSSWISDEINRRLESTKFALESLAEDRINLEISKINQRLAEIEKRLPKPRAKKSTEPKI